MIVCDFARQRFNPVVSAVERQVWDQTRKLLVSTGVVPADIILELFNLADHVECLIILIF